MPPITIRITTGFTSSDIFNFSLNRSLNGTSTVVVITMPRITEMQHNKKLSAQNWKKICFFSPPMVFRIPTSLALVKARATFRLMKLKLAIVSITKEIMISV